ncbi:hypothetical protein JCM11491_000829 [Sporobolomyces phaffii]
MPVTSYFPASHEKAPPIPISPSSPSSVPSLSRSTSSQLPSPEQAPAARPEARRRSSALTGLDDEAIRQLSARAREAERRAQWEGSKLLNLEPPSTPPRTRLASASSSLYQTPVTPASPVRSPRSPRSREHSTSYATSIRSNASSTSSQLSAVSEFLAEEEPPRFNRASATSSITSSDRLRQPRARQHSNRGSVVFPSSTSSAASSSRPVAVSPRSSFDSSSSSSEGEEAPMSARFAPRLVKTTHETDQFVQELQREKQSVLDHRQRLREERERRERGRTQSSGSGTGEGTDRSRSESGNSDASFASMTATGPVLHVPVEREAAIREEEELSGMMGSGGAIRAPGMERDDTLRPSTASSGNRWDALGERGGGAPKSIDDIVRGYKALGVGNEVKGIVERRRSSVATIQLPPRKDSSIDEYQYPTPISPAFDTFRPLSPNSTNSSSTTTSSNLLPYVPFPTPPTSTSANEPAGKIKTIEEIIAQHAGTSYLAVKKSPTSTPTSTPIAASFTTGRTRELSHISSASETSSRDSIDREVRQSVRGSSFLNHSRDPSHTSQPRERSSVLSGGGSGRQTPALALDSARAQDEARNSIHSSIRSFSVHSPSPRSSSPNPPTDSPFSHTAATAFPAASSASHELSLLLKSPRLTRLIALSRPGNANLTVSLSDVGSPTGHPVVVFLGLGSVRYMLALYDELAQALNLRLICLDRWGLGKTTSVPDSRRGFDEWSDVVREVVEDHLALGDGGYSVVAHSAGAPYAVAHAVASRSSVKGTVHLLAPWVVVNNGGSGSGTSGEGQPVGMTADNLAGMYKYLKYVPSGVLKTAQAAEWKIQGWRLGKAPLEDESLDRNGDGEDGDNFYGGPPSSAYVTPRKEKRESLASLGIGGGGEVVDKLEKLYPDGGIRLAGPQAIGIPVRGSDRSTPRRKASLSVNGRSFFGGILGGSAKSNRSASSVADDSASSLRPSVASNGRRSSYFAASAINSRSASSPSSASTPARPSGLTGPATPTSASSYRASSVLDRSPSPAPSSTLGTPLQYRPSSSSSTSADLRSPTSTTSASSTPARAAISPALLISGLLRASHAESLSGSTSDLLVLLDRSNTSKASSLRYRDVEQRVRVWYGDRDDRISESSVRWLEKEMRDCTIQVVKGADHNLMTNHQVVFDVLESISREFE